MHSTIEIPPVLCEAEVLAMLGWTRSTLNNKIASGQFPRKLTSSRKLGRVFSGPQVYTQLGIIKSIDTGSNGFVNV